MTEKITFRLPDELRESIDKVHELQREQGWDLDDSKVIRFLINKGIEKLQLEGKLKVEKV